MNFKQLEAFYWLTRLKSFQLVAEHLGLTQPAVSARISGLEEEFGIKVLDREAQGFRLTEQGLEVADFAERFVDMREAMVARLARRTRRRFAIGMVGPAALTWAELRRRLEGRADLIADMHVGSNVQLRDGIASGALDIAFLTGEAGLSPVPGSFTVRYTVGWVAPPGLVAADTGPLTPEDLRALPLILYPRTSPLHSPIADYIEETRRRPSPRHFGNALSTLSEMLRAGYGASALPLAVLEADLAAGRLVELPVTVQLPPFEVRCVHITGARKQQAAEVLAEAVAAAGGWCADHPRYARFLPPDRPPAEEGGDQP